jgi:hypothetical protein
MLTEDRADTLSGDASGLRDLPVLSSGLTCCQDGAAQLLLGCLDAGGEPFDLLELAPVGDESAA